MSSQVEQIKEKLGIVDVVSQYLKLEKAGSNFRAKCPFHNEKTPSFFVSPIRNSYYCFGCNAKGDIFSFIEQFEGLDFVGALKMLGEKAGVQIVLEKQNDRDKTSRLYKIMEDATVFFEENLKKEKNAQEYLKRRGLQEKTIRDWRIGYADDSWDSMYSYLKRTYSIQDIEKVGLIKKKESGSDYYDRFRGRITFPIFDNSNRVVAFSARILEDDEKSAKYINSPETIFFNKSKILYGYNKAKFSIRKLNFSIIVEGQMDLLASHQAGFTNTVALSGTALTIYHVNLLKRLSENTVLAFDSDSAGIASSGKSAMIALSSGMDVKVAHLTNGEDPADVLNNPSAGGKNKWKEIIKNSKHIVEFSINVLLETIKDKRMLLLRASQTVLPYIARIPNKIDQAHFVSVFAGRLGVSEDVVRAELNKALAERSVNISYDKIVIKDTPVKQNRKTSIEGKISSILLWQNSLEKPVINTDSIIKELERIIGKENALRITQKRDNMEELLFEAEKMHTDSDEKIDIEINELLNNLEQEYLKENLDLALSELRYAEMRKDTNKITEAFERYKKLSDRLSNINTSK